MAWSRTGIGLLLVAALLLRSGVLTDDVLVLVIGSGLLGCAVVTLIYASIRSRVLSGHTGMPVAMPAMACAALALTCMMAGIGGAISVVRSVWHWP